MLAEIVHDTTYGIEGQVALRLLAAAVLGGAIGFDREATEQPAGFRTHIAVAIGAALFGLMSTIGFDEYLDETGTTLSVDPTRVASNVATGIGFLGAGVIFRRGNSVRNLTTAASLWVVGAIGLACGLGDLGTAGITAVLLLISLVALRPLRTLIRDRAGTGRHPVRVTLEATADPDEVAARWRAASDVEVADLTLLKDDGRLVLSCRLVAEREAAARWMWTVAQQAEVHALVEG